jgi:hypothetical protein
VRRGSFGVRSCTLALSLVALLSAVTPAVADPEPPPSSTQPAPPPASPEALPGTAAPPVTAEQVQPDVTAPIPAQPRTLPPVDPGPDGSPDIGREPSAAQPIPALPDLNPGPDGQVPVDRAPVTPNPPVRPQPLDLPTHPGQELVDATAADALATLGRAGRLTPQGAPDLDANKLQPQVPSAQVIDPSRPATLQELINALLSGNIPPPLPVDPLALLQQLPDGIPRITYRICSESRTKAVSCSLTLPLAVPAIVDVTGDRTPDVLADLVPAAGVGDIVGAANRILGLERQIADATNRLNAILELLKDPLQVILHPELLVQKLQLEQLLNDLRSTLQGAVEALLDLVQIGLGVVALRLPTSEFAGQDLPAHVWAVYDLPTHKRLSLGFDGFRRGSSLSTAMIGVYTFNPLRAFQGIFDINATLISVGGGDSVAVTAGLANVTDDSQGNAFDPTVASARFSPVPTLFTAHAFIDPGAADREQKATVDATSSVQTHLDAQVLSDRRTESPPSDRFDQLKVDVLPTSVSAALTRPVGGGAATVTYNANSTIEAVLFADFVYSGQSLNRAVLAGARSVPAQWSGVLTSVGDKVTLTYRANGRLAALDAAFFDRTPAIVLRGALRNLPNAVTVDADLPARHVLFDAPDVLGSAEVLFSRGLGAFAPLAGDHATLILNGAAIGVSGRVTGLRKIDVFFGDHPRGTTEFSPGGQALVGAGVVDGHQKGRLDVSNLPATLSFDLNPAARTVAYRASAIIDRIKASYVDTTAGPSAVAAVNRVPASVDVNWDLGDKPHVHYKASTAVPLAELFYSPQGVETVDPNGNHYLSTALTDIPTEVDVLVDLPARHLEGVLSAPLGGINAVARTPFAGRDTLAIGELAAVPAHFDADFTNGTMRFRGISGPLGLARFAVTNHAGTNLPTGLHVAAHFREVTGDFDGGVLVRNLSHAEYSRGDAQQTVRLDSDTGGAPVFADVDVLLAANGVDDTRLAVTARIDRLPRSLVLLMNLADGKLTYTGDRSMGLLAEVRIGKIAALNGLGAPIFANGAAVRARGCDTGTGCARVETPVCTTFARCLGLVGTVNLPGFPTSIAVNLPAKQFEIAGYTQPAGAPLTAYAELIGLLPNLPRLEGLASLDGLPSNLDLTVGPITVDGNPARVDVGYHASAPLGTLRVNAEAATATSFGTLRGAAAVSRLPATLHVVGTFDAVTTLGVHSVDTDPLPGAHPDQSAPIQEISATLSDVDSGFLSASATGVPADLDVKVDAPAKHFESVLSAPMGGLTFAAARVPFQGRQYQAFAQAVNLPTQLDADWADGNFRFRGVTGAVGAARFAVTNHAGALAPSGQHVAAHFRQATGDLDASAAVNGLSLVALSRNDSGLSFDLRSGSGAFAFDGDVVLAANGADDIRFAGFGVVSLPSHLDIAYGNGKFSYHTDRPAGILAEARIGKVAAINGIGRVPLYAHGLALEAAGCDGGAGCVRDNGPICTLLGKCFGAVGTVNLPGLPTAVDVDMAARKIDIVGYRPPAGVDLAAYVRVDGLFAAVPHAAGLAVLRGLPSPFDLHIGPWGFDESNAPQLVVQYTSSGPIGALFTAAEADTTAVGNVRGRADVTGVPDSLKVTGTFGKNSHVRVESSRQIDEVSTEFTLLFPNDPPASGRARLAQVPACAAGSPPRCVDVDVKGTDDSGSPLKVPVVTVTSAAPGMDVEAYVEGELAVATDPVRVQVHDIFANLIDLGETVTTEITESGGQFVTSIRSRPGKTGSLLVGGSFSLQQPDRINFSSFEQRIFGCFGIPLLELHVDDGHVQAQSVRINRLYAVADGVSDLVITPGPSYVAFGVDGTYDRFAMVAPELEAHLDLHVHLRVEKFDQPLFPAYEFTLDLHGQDTYNALRFHVFDMKKRVNARFEVTIAGFGTGIIYPEEHSPGILTYTEPAPGSGLSGIMILPPTDVGDAANRKFVFTFVDPGMIGSSGPGQFLSGEAAQLIDIAVSRAFSPFPPEGESGGGGGPCG